MGHSKGRDNAKKRAKRRKKTERLALARKNSGEHARAGTARVDGNAARGSWHKRGNASDQIAESGLQKNLIRKAGTQERSDS